jgi:hypothetical protein
MLSAFNINTIKKTTFYLFTRHNYDITSTRILFIWIRLFISSSIYHRKVPQAQVQQRRVSYPQPTTQASTLIMEHMLT